MIPKDDLKTINESDLDSLIQNEIQEDKTLEYKREFPLISKENKQKFLEGVSSFANASGGDLIIGIKVDSESKLPKILVGVSISSQPIDEMVRGLDDIIRQGIQPRIPIYSIQPIKLKTSNYAIVIRIKKSWIGPHRITLGGYDKFYTRGAAGKYPMDVTELRSAFLLTETRIEKIKSFILERISSVYSNEAPCPLNEGAKVILHVIPFSAFDPEHIIAFQENEKIIDQVRTITNYQPPFDYNIDGGIKINQIFHKNYSYEYIQFFRNGIIESVCGNFLISHEDKCIPLYKFEKCLIETTDNYLKTLKLLKIYPPILIQISLTNIKNYRRYESTDFDFEKLPEIYKDIIQLPAAIIEDYERKSEQILHNAFNALSNACGLPKSCSYDVNGKWVKNSLF